jgi:hypothetical protein
MLIVMLNPAILFTLMHSITLIPLGSGATEARLAALEQRLDTTLPESYREFLLQNDGACPEQSAGQLTAFNVEWAGQSWAHGFRTGFLRCLYTTQDLPGMSLSWAHSKELLTQVRSLMPRETVPVGGDLGSNSILLGISGDKRGKVFYWVNDYASTDDDAEPTYDNVGFIANSFTEFLESLYPWKEDSK